MSSQAVTLPETFGSGASNSIIIGAEEEIRKEREVEEIVRDMNIMRIPPDVLRLIALGEISSDDPDAPLIRPGYCAAAVWANSELGQQAAARKLAEEDNWNLKIAARHAKTGYQRFLRSNPLLRNITHRYCGGDTPLDSISIYEEYFDFSGVDETIQSMTLNDFRKISVSFLEMILPDSEFAKENEVVSTVIRWKLAERKDLFSKGLNQLDKTRRNLLKKIADVVEREKRKKKARQKG